MNRKKQKKTLAKQKKRDKTYKPPDKRSKIEVLPPDSGLVVTPKQNAITLFDAMTMDSTTVIEISFMQNETYAPQIISNIIKPEHVDKLLDLKERDDVQAFLHEGKTRIIDICRGIDSLEAHTSMFVVLAMMQIGRILNEIHDALGVNDRLNGTTVFRRNGTSAKG